MKGLDFKCRIFRNQDLSHWFLVGVDLGGAYLEGANLYGASLGGENLSGAFYDKYTVFPDGFDPVAVGMNKVDTLF